MKNLILLIATLVFLLLIFQCRRNTSLPVRPGEQTVEPIKIILGGCNGMTNASLSKIRNMENDTVYYNWKDDTLVFHIGVNHICCVKFKAEYTVTNDTLQLKIKDTCTQSDLCYCRCVCDYTFDYLFSATPDFPGAFEVSLYDAMWDTTKIIERGIIYRK